MAILTFTETGIPADKSAVDDSLPADSFTPSSGLCAIPGCTSPPATYKGKGKRPIKCDEHRLTTAPKSGSASGSTSSPRWKDALYMQLAGLTMGVSAAVSAADSFDAKVISRGAPNWCQSAVDLAEVDPKFRKWLEKGLKGNAYAGFAIATASILLPILAHHGVIPGPIGKRIADNFAAEEKDQRV